MSFSVDGLASGLNTSQIIAQLMQAERQPLVRMQARQATFDKRVAAWGQIETKVNALSTALKDLREASDFNLFSATSSNDTIFTATASSSAAPGPFSFTVEALAAAHQRISAGFSGSDALVGSGVATIGQALGSVGVSSVDASTGGLATGGYDIEVAAVDTGANTATVVFDGTEQTVSLGPGTVTLTSANGSLDITVGTALQVGTAKVTVLNTDAATTLADVRTAINDAGGGTKASIINVGSGTNPYKLIVTSDQTGTANALTVDLSALSGFSGGFTDLRAAADATLTIGGGTQTIVRSSNTITDLVDGVTFNLHQASPGTEVTLNVEHDHDAIVAKVKALVDAINGVFGTVDTHAKYDTAKEKGGVLVGESRARFVKSQIQEALQHTDTSLTYSYLGSVGVTVQRDGTYALDETKLREALAADFDGVVTMFTRDVDAARAGVMGTLHDAVEVLREPGGLIDDATDAAQATSDRIGDQIDAFEIRLGQIETRYRRQFSALETTLGQLANQGSWLSAQIAGMMR